MNALPKLIFLETVSQLSSVQPGLRFQRPIGAVGRQLGVVGRTVFLLGVVIIRSSPLVKRSLGLPCEVVVEFLDELEKVFLLHRLAEGIEDEPVGVVDPSDDGVHIVHPLNVVLVQVSTIFHLNESEKKYCSFSEVLVIRDEGE